VPAEALPPEHHGDDSIYGLETDPVDSLLDLARAYIDMGDDESARPVLTQVIEQGSLSQKAEARALLNRLDVS
jgi:pilus assembly protein FimV